MTVYVGNWVQFYREGRLVIGYHVGLHAPIPATVVVDVMHVGEVREEFITERRPALCLNAADAAKSS